MTPDTKPTPKKVSRSEVGHAKNTSNLGTLATAVESFGTVYTPASTALTAANLKTIKTNAEVVLGKIDAANAAYTTAANRRQAAFEGMSKITTRVLGAVKALCTAKEYKDAQSIVKKIRGGGNKKAKAAADGAAPDAKTASTSQMSFDSRLDNFRQLTALLAGIPAYNPNEAGLKVSGLNAYLNNLVPHNEAVAKPWDALVNLRAERDKLLYAPDTGAVALAARVKAYVKSVYGAGTKQYKLVSGIEFKIVK